MPFPEETEFVLPNGLTLNSDRDADGVLITCASVSGWGSPGSKSQGTPREGEHGNSPAPNPKLDARVLNLQGRIDAPTRLLRQQAEHRLEAALGLQLFDLTVVDSIELHTQAQRSGKVDVDDDTDTACNWMAELTCPDPRRYGASKQVTMSLPSVTGGLRFPIRFPIRFTGSSISGDDTVTNEGNESAPLVVTFTGPLTTPKLTNLLTGQCVQYNDVLATQDDFVVLYLRFPLVVLLQGTALRTGKVSTGGGGVFGIKPGPNALSFRAAAGTGTALIEFDDTYQ
jgi:hypothetical protein